MYLWMLSLRWGFPTMQVLRIGLTNKGIPFHLVRVSYHGNRRLTIIVGRNFVVSRTFTVPKSRCLLQV